MLARYFTAAFCLLCSSVGGAQESSSPSASTDKTRSTGTGWQVSGIAGTAFAGLRLAEQLTVPAYSPVQGGFAAAGDSLDLVRNTRVIWRPAFAAGLELSYMWTIDLGVGIATQMVTITRPNGDIGIWPAVTVHLGGKSNQVFLGYMFSQSDRVLFPNGQDRFRLPRTNPLPSFVQPNVSAFGAFIVGLTVGGLRITGKKEATASP
jgi:hypothetical protein